MYIGMYLFLMAIKLYVSKIYWNNNFLSIYTVADVYAHLIYDCFQWRWNKNKLESLNWIKELLPFQIIQFFKKILNLAHEKLINWPAYCLIKVYVSAKNARMMLYGATNFQFENFWQRKLTLKFRIMQFLTAFMQVYARPKIFYRAGYWLWS